MKKELLQILGMSLIVMLFVMTGFTSAEPVLLQALTASDQVIVTLNVDAGVSITSPADTTMSNSLGVSNNKAIATTTWNVKTNNAAGYTLAVKASSSPAMRLNTNVATFINDYTEASSDVPETWSVDAATAEFGYSAYGTDISTGTWGTAGTLCGATSTPSTSLKYLGFSTSDFTIASRSSTTTQSGVDSTVCYAVEQGSTNYIASGIYSAWITATATTQ